MTVTTPPPTTTDGSTPAVASGAPPPTLDLPPEVPTKHLHSGWRVAAYRRLALLADRTTAPPSDLSTLNPTGAETDLKFAAEGFKDHSLRSWWSGTAEEAVNAGLDRAERALVPRDPAALVPGLTSKAKRRFRTGDARRAAIDDLLKATPSRGRVIEVLDLLHGGSFDLRTSQRGRRNRMLATGLLFIATAVGLAIALDAEVGGISLADAATGSGAAKGTANPWLVLAAGAAGALLTVIPMLRRAGSVIRSGAPWIVQALFKVVSGALVALLGAWLVQSGVLDVVEPQDATVLTVWAIVFGASQDVITKKLDERLAVEQPPIAPSDPADEDV